MPLCAVLDSTVLVSAFLTPRGAADAVLQYAVNDRFLCCLADAILEEISLRLASPRLQQRYTYGMGDVEMFSRLLRTSFVVLADLPPLTGIVRDPNDDMILACAVAAGASHVVTRDDDLLALGVYEGIAIVTPETFLGMLRSAEYE
jgi:putative PIN family toxin of toxin-antitoxin system